MFSMLRPGRGASPQPLFIQVLEGIFKKVTKVEPRGGKYAGMRSHGLSCGSTSRMLGESLSETICMHHLRWAWTFLSFWERTHGFCGDKVTYMDTPVCSVSLSPQEHGRNRSSKCTALQAPMQSSVPNGSLKGQEGW